MVRRSTRVRAWALGIATSVVATCTVGGVLAAKPPGSKSHDFAYWLFPASPRLADCRSALPEDVQTDNFGNAWVTRGSGAPHVLVLAHRDSPSWIVSEVTPDGFLRVQRLGTGATPLVDQFMAGKRFVVYTRAGVLPAVTVVPSTHLRRAATVPVPEATVSDLWLDVGAESEREAADMGITLLDPVVPLQHEEAANLLGGYGAGARKCCTLLGDLAESLPPTVRGTLTCAWVAGGTEGARGSLRLHDKLGPVDSVIVLEAVPAAETDSLARPIALARQLVVFPADSTRRASVDWAAELHQHSPNLLALASGPVVPDARVWAQAGVPTAVVGVPVAYPGSPGEIAGGPFRADDLDAALGLPDASMTRMSPVQSVRPIYQYGSEWAPFALTGSAGAALHRTAWATIATVLAPYGVSEHEGSVAHTIKEALPAEAQKALVRDARGNLVLALGAGPPGRLFVAHMDEIGYRVTAADPDGRLRVERKGGFFDWLYEGETVRVEQPRGETWPGIIAPRMGARLGPRPAVLHPLDDEPHLPASPASRFDVSDVRLDLGDRARGDRTPAWIGADVTVLHEIARLGQHRFAARAIDDRFGDAALILAARELWPERHHLPNPVWLVWSVEEETGLKGATWLADSLAHHHALPIRVHAVDTFVSSDSPLENPRIGGARLGKGAVIRAVDTSHEAPLPAVRATLALAEREGIPLQYGVTAGGNDGVPFAEHGSINVPLGWPLRSSHSAVEVADLRDLESLARLVRVLAEQPARDDARLP